jgi:receptor-binding and translocation channel-forming TcA subunit of Tc toxin
MDVKKRALDEANATLEQLNASRNTPKFKLQYYLQLLGTDTSSIPADASQTFTEIDNLFDKPSDDGGLLLIPSEADEIDKADTAKNVNLGAGIAEAISAIFHALPSETIHATPIGVGLSIQWGFPFAANASSAIARGVKIGADYLSAESALAGMRTNFLKQRQDRVQQANVAGYELTSIDKQILTQQVRIDIAGKDITTQQAQMDNSQDVLTYLQSKYTNQQLYAWLDQQTQSLCYSAYTLAYDLAKRVEKVYMFERPLDKRSYIQYGYWDQAHNGLLAGERLSSALRQLEAAYQMDRGYDYEITKNVSLRLTQPLQLLSLRQTGSCKFDLPEIYFDMDFPGQYLRRIKSVSLTLPCVTGPYTAVSCTLRLLSHSYRTSPQVKGVSDYPRAVDNQDDRFATTNIPISAIATSNAQSDAGLFELDFRSGERYLPFEGAGAISSWSLQLPGALRQFDYSTITDAILTVRYTSNEGGAQLQAAAAGSVAGFVKSVDNLSNTEGLFQLWDLKAEFATDWYRIANPPAAGSDPTQRIMTLRKLNQGLPSFTAAAKKVIAVDIYLVSTTPLPAAAPSVALVTTTASGTALGDAVLFEEGASVRSLSVYQAVDADLQIGTWQFTIADDTVALDRIWLILRYTMG